MSIFHWCKGLDQAHFFDPIPLHQWKMVDVWKSGCWGGTLVNFNEFTRICLVSLGDKTYWHLKSCHSKALACFCYKQWGSGARARALDPSNAHSFALEAYSDKTLQNRYVVAAIGNWARSEKILIFVVIERFCAKRLTDFSGQLLGRSGIWDLGPQQGSGILGITRSLDLGQFWPQSEVRSCQGNTLISDWGSIDIDM